MAKTYMDFVLRILILEGRHPTDDEEREFWRLNPWLKPEKTMRHFIREYWIPVALVTFVIGFCIILFTSIKPIRPAIHEEGRAAFNAGVPSTANPYSFRSAVEGSYWLNGWVDAATEAKAINAGKADGR
jgi:ribosome modulation factor